VKVKPQHLKLANKVAGVKDSSASTAKKFYWSGVHKLKVDGNNLVLMSHDGNFWLEWYMPTEDAPIEMDTIIQAEPFDYAARYLDGGSLDITREGGIVTLHKGQLNYRLREESHQQYPTPEPGENPITWVGDSAIFAKALKYVIQFIDETNSSQDKSVATLYHDDKTLWAGHPKRMGIVHGLEAAATMSFKAKGAKVVAEFLSSISDKVQITVTNRNYTFYDPAGKHKLIISAENGRFPKVTQNIGPMLKETVIVDRKMLLTRAKLYAGAMQQGSDRLNLYFRGTSHNASLRISTPGETEQEITSDEFGVIREMAVEVPAGSAIPETSVAIMRSTLESTIEQMEGTTLKWLHCGRMVVIEDEDVNAEVENGEAATPTPAAALRKSAVITVQTLRQAEEEERRLKEEAAKAAAEESKAKVTVEATTDGAVEVSVTEAATVAVPATPEPAAAPA